MKVVDTQGNEYLPLDTTQSGFGLDFGERDPARRRRAAAGLAGVVRPDVRRAGPVPREARSPRPTTSRSSSRSRSRARRSPPPSRSTSERPASLLLEVARERDSRATAPIRIMRHADHRQPAARASREPSGDQPRQHRERRARRRPPSTSVWPMPPRAASTAPTTASTRPTIARPNGSKTTSSAPSAGDQHARAREPDRAGLTPGTPSQERPSSPRGPVYSDARAGRCAFVDRP